MKVRSNSSAPRYKFRGCCALHAKSRREFESSDGSLSCTGDMNNLNSNARFNAQISDASTHDSPSLKTLVPP